MSPLVFYLFLRKWLRKRNSSEPKAIKEEEIIFFALVFLLIKVVKTEAEMKTMIIEFSDMDFVTLQSILL